MQRAINKSAQNNVQAGEIHYGQIAGAPIQCHAVTGAGSGGAAAGSNIRKVPVLIDGNKNSQLCAYPADYYPMTGDVVKLILVGTDKKARGHYLVMNRLASGQNPDHDSKIVAETGAGGTILTATSTAILSFDPFAVFGIIQGIFRISWGAWWAAGNLLAQAVSYDGGGARTYGLTGIVESTSTNVVFYTATTIAGNVAGIPLTLKWGNSAAGGPIKVMASSSGTMALACAIEQIG